jgi:hypothetical protein
MKTIKLRTIKSNSRLLRGASCCLIGKYLQVSDGNMLVPFDGEATYVVIDGERVRCAAPGEYWVRSTYYHQRNERQTFLSSDTVNDGAWYGSNTTTHYKIRVI